MYVSVNPGTGPVIGATRKNAIKNIKRLIKDIGIEGVSFVRVPDCDSEGRFTFLIWKDNRCHEISMPGLPLEQVRFTGKKSQRIWDYPRLYIDGSSFVWRYVVKLAFREDME